MYPGFVGSAGIIAALLAQRGILGPWGTLESRYGLFNTYFRGRYDRGVVVDGIGRQFEMANLSFKPWPSCALSHQYIDATLRIVTEQNVQPEEIESINLAVGDVCRDLCEPIEKRRAPETTNDAKYNIPFAVAIAALKRNVVNRDFTPEALREPAVLAMAGKTSVTFDPELNRTGEGNSLPPGRVKIRTRNNDVYTQRVDFPYGHHRNPMTVGDLIAKFRDCATFSGVTIPRENVERVVDRVMGLEEVKDVSIIPRLLSGRGATWQQSRF
jgi:2-methylcitrate dehydratase PrpD